ncbi:MAG: 50S ribosomal protein L17 [Bacteroidetes bacterium QS_8_64_10]|jgi:large subunit ribosomal protein L17|nr:MAG: 50S ribosomal protein L17 [Bacteroidetes bacterium QS_8_64_10]
MRHRKKGKKLGRAKGHRKRTLQALSHALIEHKRITTTTAKAKALRPFVEPLITRAKEDTDHNRRQVFRHLQNKHAVKELFGDVAAQVGDRPGGYTRIVKLGQRSGDGAEMAVVELVDYNDVKPDTGSGRTRTRRGSGKGRRNPDDE